ncbi:MAG: GntR family transcriptional regulator [Angelakisella sp.]
MEILISSTSGEPIYRQIVAQVRQMIMSGTLREGDSLPSMRLLAKELRISLITTKRAYEELEAMGLLVTVGGKGCFVGGASPQRLLEEHKRELTEHFEKAATAAHSAGIPLAEAQKLFEAVYMKGVKQSDE